MAEQVETQLVEIGKRLSQPSASKDALSKVLKQAASLFSEVDQSPPPDILLAMKPSMDALVQPGLLNHKDKEIRLFVATCISEIMRIVAPDAPYSDEVLKEIFQLIVATFQGLDEISSPSFSRRVSILETVAKVRSCVVMLDLECDDLILEMFQAFFSTASEEHPQNVLVAMRTIMSLVIEESEDIPQPLLDLLLNNLLKERVEKSESISEPLVDELLNNLFKEKDVSPAAHQLAMAVFQRCAKKLEPYVQRFLTSFMSKGNMSQSGLREDYHDLIYKIYRCAPSMLFCVIPNLMEELLTDEVDVRVKAVQLLGRLFALPGDQMLQEYRQLFSEFVKRFTDKAIEVRLAVTDCAKTCLLAKPSGPGAEELLTALKDRLQDYETKVRTHVVAAICELDKSSPTCVPIDILRRVAERLRDKEVFVRKSALQSLTEVYRFFCLRCFEGSFVPDEPFDWIPSKIFRCCFDKDCRELRPQAIELVFTEELFPPELPVQSRVKHWVSIFSNFDKNDKKAFGRILSQKQRLQLEMQNYLSLRQKVKEEDSEEDQKKLHNCCKNMLASFVDPAKAEEDFQKLNQLKDNNVLKALALLLDPNTTLSEAEASRGELLKRLGEKHPQYDFMKILATKCSYMLFGKEHVKAVLNELALYRAEGKEELLEACMSLLVEFAVHFPVLVEGADEALTHLLEEGNEHVKEGVAQILAKASGFMCGQFMESSGSVLEKLCLQGSRKQAKYAVQALATRGDSGLKALSQLYLNLVELLETTAHLPTVLQSLGCIAQYAMPIFETREDDIIQFVVRNLFRRESGHEDKSLDWNDASEECRLKIYGLKTLIKSFLPNKDAHLRQRLKGLFGVLVKVLDCGEISEEVKSSDVDKAHLRLAAAKGVLRLSKRWDAQISPQLFHSTVLISQDPLPHVRREFLRKVHQYLKERLIPHKYACAFPLSISDAGKEILVEVKQYMVDFVESCRREAARLKQSIVSGQSDGTLITHYPEYVIFYFVHTQAHHASFPPLDGAGEIAETFAPLYKKFLFILWVLLRQDGEGRGDVNKKEELENPSVILSIFRMLKQAQDAIDTSRNEKSYFLADIGILVTKELLRNQTYSENNIGPIPLPSGFYKPSEDIVVDTPKEDGSHLPTYLLEADILSQIQDFQSELYLEHVPSLHLGMKRVRTVDEGPYSEEAGREESEHPHKRTRHHPTVDSVDQDNGGLASPAVVSKPSHGRRRTPKDKSSKAPERSSKVPETGVVNTLDHSVSTSSKRKRGRVNKENGDLSSPEQKRGRPDEEFALASSDKRKRGRPKGTGRSVDGGEVLGSDLGSIEPENKGVSTIETPGKPTEPLTEGLNILSSDKRKASENSAVKPVRLSVKRSWLGQEILSELLPQSSDQAVHPEESTEPTKRGEGRRSRKNLESHQELLEKPAGDVVRSPRGTPRKTTKKISISGLEKTPDVNMEDDGDADEKLVGCKIKVWWPLDKQFYEGVVVSFDPMRKKHKVSYADGDVELLTLSKERWERVDEAAPEEEGQPGSPPSTPTPVLPSPKARKKATPPAQKGQVKQDPKEESLLDRAVSSPRRRKSISAAKNESASIGSPLTGASADMVDAHDEANLTSEDKAEGNEGGDHAQETNVPKGAQRSRRRTVSVKAASEGLAQSQSLGKGSKNTLDRGIDGASSPTGSKDSDDVPLNAWKSRTRKVH